MGQEEINNYPQEEINNYPQEEMNNFQQEEVIRFERETNLLKGCKYTQYGCCPDGQTNRKDVQGSNCLRYPNPVQPYSNQDNNYVINSNSEQNIKYVTDTQNPYEIPDNGPFNRTLYLY